MKLLLLPKPRSFELSNLSSYPITITASTFLSFSIPFHSSNWSHLLLHYDIYIYICICMYWRSVISSENCFSYSKEALDVNAKLLEINPESYTAWNYRKLAVQHNLTHSNSDPDSAKSILDEELRVVLLFIWSSALVIPKLLLLLLSSCLFTEKML